MASLMTTFLVGEWAGFKPDALPSDALGMVNRGSHTALRLIVCLSVAIATGCGSSSSVDPGMAIELLGDGGHVEFSEALIGDRGVFTIEFWIKPMWPPVSAAPNPERNAIYMEGSDGLQRNRIFISADNIDNPDDEMGATTITSWPGDVAPTVFTGPLTEGVWQHVAYVRDGGSLRIYVDGLLAAEGSAVSYTGAAPAGYRLGLVVNSISGDEWGRFVIDDVRVSSTARYAADFQPPVVHTMDASTLSLWRLDETAGALTGDETGNHTDGVLSASVVRVVADR